MGDVSDAMVWVGQQAMWTVVLSSAPILIPVLGVGLLVGIVQAATSVNEATLSFVPKLVVVAAVLALFGSAILGTIADFTRDIFVQIALAAR